jgi:hypothetical protein
LTCGKLGVSTKPDDPTMAAPLNGTYTPHPDPLDQPLKTALVRLASGISPASVAMAQVDWLTHLAVLPSKQSALAMSAWRKSFSWLQYAASCGWKPDASHCIAPPPDDKRFSHAAWQLPPYNALAQGFLLAQQWWGEATTDVRGVSRHHEELAAFIVRQWLDMLSPSNSPVLNPQVLGETVRKGASTSSTASPTGGATRWRWRPTAGRAMSRNSAPGRPWRSRRARWCIAMPWWN